MWRGRSSRAGRGRYAASAPRFSRSASAAAALGAALLGILVPTLTRVGPEAAEQVTVELAAAPAAGQANSAVRPGALAVLVADATEPLLISRAGDAHALDDAPDLGSVPTAAVDPASVLASGFVRPVEGTITSRYGPRFHPILQVWKLHTGIDIGAACGTPVKAVKDGKVSFVGIAGGYGNRVVVDHGNGLATTYNHFSAYAATAGLQVRQGQIIGYVGTTGLSTGCHLHFEVVVNGSIVDAGPYLDLAPAPKVVIPPAVTATTPPPPAPPPPATPRAATPTPPPAPPPPASTPPATTPPPTTTTQPPTSSTTAPPTTTTQPPTTTTASASTTTRTTTRTTTKTTQPPVSKPPTPSPTAVEEPSTPSTSSTTTAP